MAAERRPLGPKSTNAQVVSPVVSRQSSLSSRYSNNNATSTSIGNGGSNGPSRHNSVSRSFGDAHCGIGTEFAGQNHQMGAPGVASSGEKTFGTSLYEDYYHQHYSYQGVGSNLDNDRNNSNNGNDKGNDNNDEYDDYNYNYYHYSYNGNNNKNRNDENNENAAIVSPCSPVSQYIPGYHPGEFQNRHSAATNSTNNNSGGASDRIIAARRSLSVSDDKRRRSRSSSPTKKKGSISIRNSNIGNKSDNQSQQQQHKHQHQQQHENFNETENCRNDFNNYQQQIYYNGAGTGGSSIGGTSNRGSIISSKAPTEQNSSLTQQNYLSQHSKPYNASIAPSYPSSLSLLSSASASSSANPTIRLVPKTPPASAGKEQEDKEKEGNSYSISTDTLLKADLAQSSTTLSLTSSNRTSLQPGYPHYQLRNSSNYSEPSSTKDETASTATKFSSTSTRHSSKRISSYGSPPSTVSQWTIQQSPLHSPSQTPSPSPSSVRRRSKSSPVSHSNETLTGVYSSGSQPKRASSRFSNPSFLSSVEALGLPPSRPLPEPPVTPAPAATLSSSHLQPLPKPTIRLVEKTPPAPSTPPSPVDTVPPLPVPRPILKKSTRTQTGRPGTADSAEENNYSINASDHPEIRPALSWILEAEPLETSRIIGHPQIRRPRMHSDAALSGAHYRNRSNSGSGRNSGSGSGSFSVTGNNGKPNNTVPGFNPLDRPSRWFSVSDRSTTMSTIRPNGSGPSNGNGSAWAHPGPENQPRLVHPSQSRAGHRLSRAPSTLSIFSSRGFPDWARLYYGRGGKGLPSPPDANNENRRRVQRFGNRHTISLRQLHSRGGDSVEDDLQISEIQPPRRALQPTFQTPVEWVGTLNPEGRDLADQFHSPRLDNRPLVRTERFNPHLLFFLAGFVFPLAWVFGAIYPLPDQKRLRYRESQYLFPPNNENPNIRRPSMDTESLPSITTVEETRRWDNGRWWRNINRGMSVIGILILSAIVALVVIGTMKKTTAA